MKSHLTDLSISKFVPADTYLVWDTDLPTFGLRVGKRRKTFVLKHHNRYHILGHWPIVSLKQARNEAKRRLALKYFPSPALPAKDAIERFLEAKRSSLRPSSLFRYQLNLDHFPATPSLAELKPHHLSLSGVPPAQANLRFAVFKAFLSWCKEQGITDTNPLQGIKSPHRRSNRDRLLTDDEIKKIWMISWGHSNAGMLFRALILSGQRISQLQHFDPAWIRGDTVTWPATLMKNKEAHSLPLTPLLRDNLPPQRIYPHQIETLKTALNIPDFRPHDFRRYLSSTMSKLKVPIDITEAILAHTSGSRSAIQRIYDRDARLPQMREALGLYEKHLLGIISK